MNAQIIGISGSPFKNSNSHLLLTAVLESRQRVKEADQGTGSFLRR